VNTEGPTFIAAGRDNATITRPANEDGFAVEAPVEETFHRHKKGVEVQV
jgi:hypothetical protein